MAKHLANGNSFVEFWATASDSSSSMRTEQVYHRVCQIHNMNQDYDQDSSLAITGNLFAFLFKIIMSGRGRGHSDLEHLGANVHMTLVM